MTWRSSHIDEFLKGTRSAHLRLWITNYVDREWYPKSTNCRARAREQRLQQGLHEFTRSLFRRCGNCFYRTFWSGLKQTSANWKKVLRGLFNPIRKKSFWNLLSSARYRYLLSSFITGRKEKNPNFKYWWQYMDMVHILLLFVRSQKEEIWDLNLHAFHKMLQFFFHCYDHTNYACISQQWYKPSLTRTTGS